MDWCVVANQDLDGDDYTKGYEEGNTGWVCSGYHDVLWRNRDRIDTIYSLFNGKTGWYKEVELTVEQLDELRKYSAVSLEELEFKFETGRLMDSYYEVTANGYPRQRSGIQPYDCRYRSKDKPDAIKWAKEEKERGAVVKILMVTELDTEILLCGKRYTDEIEG